MYKFYAVRFILESSARNSYCVSSAIFPSRISVELRRLGQPASQPAVLLIRRKREEEVLTKAGNVPFPGSKYKDKCVCVQ